MKKEELTEEERLEKFLGGSETDVDFEKLIDEWLKAPPKETQEDGAETDMDLEKMLDEWCKDLPKETEEDLPLSGWEGIYNVTDEADFNKDLRNLFEEEIPVLEEGIPVLEEDASPHILDERYEFKNVVERLGREKGMSKDLFLIYVGRLYQLRKRLGLICDERDEFKDAIERLGEEKGMSKEQFLIYVGRLYLLRKRLGLICDDEE